MIIGTSNAKRPGIDEPRLIEERCRPAAIAIQEKILGKEHPGLVKSLLQDFAKLPRKAGEDARAREMDDRAKAILAKAAA